MSKMIPRGIIRYDDAKTNYDKYKINRQDAHLDTACHYLHQCMELCLKGLVEIFTGEEWARGHELAKQINPLIEVVNLNKNKESEIDFSILYNICVKLNNKISEYDKWYNPSRYEDNFVVTTLNVDEAFEICKELIDFCNSIIKVETHD